MNTFTCARCGETFISDPSFGHDARQMEHVKNFGIVSKKEARESVCGDCYDELMKLIAADEEIQVQITKARARSAREG